MLFCRNMERLSVNLSTKRMVQQNPLQNSLSLPGASLNGLNVDISGFCKPIHVGLVKPKKTSTQGYVSEW